jgi:hypothetical protein
LHQFCPWDFVEDGTAAAKALGIASILLFCPENYCLLYRHPSLVGLEIGIGL